MSLHGAVLKQGAISLPSVTTLWHKWEDDIRMDLGEMGKGGVDWMHMAHDRDQWQAAVNTVMNLRFYKRWGIS
jgi:hypothetical protein